MVGAAQRPGNGLAGEGGRIPYRLWIGVTGHRTVPDDPALRAQIRSVVDQIHELTPHSANTATCWGVISPLAEGADQLVAREIQTDENAALETPLPFAVDRYVKDFTSEGSQLLFRELIERASLITVLPESRSRDAAYAQVGEYVVDHCDVLIALWDGEGARGQGGTAEVVDLARSRAVPLFWIFSKPDYEVQKELGPGVHRQAFEEVDTYNRARISETRFKKNVDKQKRRWSQAATFAGLPAHHLSHYLRWIVPVGCQNASGQWVGPWDGAEAWTWTGSAQRLVPGQGRRHLKVGARAAKRIVLPTPQKQRCRLEGEGRLKTR